MRIGAVCYSVGSEGIERRKKARCFSIFFFNNDTTFI